VTERLDAFYRCEAEAGRVNGSVLVAVDGQAVLAKGYGFADFATQRLNDVSTVFKIGSLTKAFVSVVLAQLVEEGRLAWTDPLDRYIEGFPNGDEITIHELMSHTAGVWCYLQEPDSPFWTSMDVPHTPRWLLECIWGRPLKFKPGTQWRYSNSGYVLLGVAIERLTGKPLGEVLAERVFEPLGLRSTIFDPTETSLRDRRATGYLNVTDSPPAVAPNLHASVTYASGAIVSTVTDLYKWDRAIRARRLVSPESWQTLLTPVLADYACGWWMQDVRIAGQTHPTEWHWGVCYGYHGLLVRLIDQDITIIVLQNFMPEDLLDPANPAALLRLRDRTLGCLFQTAT
jgi:CubicO group peptidase (beta-lactamase class C family)